MSDQVPPTISTEHMQQQQQQQQKEAEWTQIQAELAAQLHLPRTELFDLTPTTTTNISSEGSADTETTSEVCGDSSAFVHTDFLLPRAEIEAAFNMTLEEKETEENPPPQHYTVAHETPNFLRQLRQDYQRQQQYLAGQQEGQAPIPPLAHIAGLDISFVPGTNLGVACCVVLRFPSLEVERTYFTHCELREPYVSGFLAFREVEPVLALFRTYREELLLPPTSVLWRPQGPPQPEGERAAAALPPLAPQLLFLDGCGVLHPRRCGLASHLGALLDLPTIGVSKKMLVVGSLTRDYVAGLFSPPPPPVGGRKKREEEEEEELFRLRPLLTCSPSALREAVSPSSSRSLQLYGYALQQTSSLKKCVYVSPGNKIGYALAVALVRCVSRHRIPEPTRQADLRSREYIRQHFGGEATEK